MTSANIDFVALIIFILIAIAGYYNGFLKTFSGLLGNFIGVIFSLFSSKTAVMVIDDKTAIIGKLSEKILSRLIGMFDGNVLSCPIVQVNGGEQIDGIIYKIVLFFRSKTNDVLNGVSSLQLNVGEYLAHTLSYYICLILSFIVLFVLFKVLIFIITDRFLPIKNTIIFNAIDKPLGFCVGIINGAIAIEVLAHIAMLISIVCAPNIFVEIQSTKIVNYFVINGIIANII